MAREPLTAPHFEPVDDIGFIEVDAIDMGERLRPVDPMHVEVLGRAMLREGQATPIVVCRLPGRNVWTLVAGAHRVEAARKFEIPQLKAEMIAPDKIVRRQREISENLWRKDLDPVDRANFIAELVRLAKLRVGIDPEAAGRTASANARWQKQVQSQADDASATIAHAYGWTDQVAEETGLSRRTVYNDLLLHSRISPSEIERLRKRRHPVATNAKQLRALAKLEPVDQSKVVSLLLHSDMKQGGPAKSVGEAWSRVQGKTKPTPDAEAKRLSAFVGAFGRMSLAEKKGALQQLSGQLPAGIRLVTAGSSEAIMRTRMLDAIGSLETASKVLGALVDDEPVEPEHLHDACGEVQHALIGLNDLKRNEE